mmetsp:Transcript_12242/g.19590  ORF Transcript_12242/g.19590 Transcript_12242/m.19590 type:complete len:257 (+) Transcript_12242:186-956(+)
MLMLGYDKLLLHSSHRRIGPPVLKARRGLTLSSVWNPLRHQQLISKAFPVAKQRPLQIPLLSTRSCIIRPKASFDAKDCVWADAEPLKIDRQKGNGLSRKIVVCLDASDYSGHALDWCAKKLFRENDEVHLLNVFDFEPIPMSGPLDTFSEMESIAHQNAQLELRGQQNAIKLMKTYQKRCAEQGKVIPIAAVFQGSCNRKICEYAEDMDAELLVLASRGLGNFKRFLLGSVSDYCVHNCKVPVLVVKDEMNKDSG